MSIDEKLENVFNTIADFLNELGYCEEDIPIISMLVKIINELGFHIGYDEGLEMIGIPDKDISPPLQFHYLQSDDIYDITLGYDKTEKQWIISSVGDWQEENEKQYCIDNDCIKCHICNEYFDLPSEEYHAIECPYCRELIDDKETEFRALFAHGVKPFLYVGYATFINSNNEKYHLPLQNLPTNINLQDSIDINDNDFIGQVCQIEHPITDRYIVSDSLADLQDILFAPFKTTYKKV